MKKLLQLLNSANVGKTDGAVSFLMQAAEGETVLYLYGLIADWDISAIAVSKALANIDAKATVRMRLNSAGGDVMEARAMCTAMREFRNGGGKIIVQVDALAASCAGWIALQADEVEIADGGFFMAHNAMAACFGNAADMTAMAGLLTKVEGTIVQEYVTATGKTAEVVQAWLDAETWFTAQEAVDNGLADRIVSQLAAKPSNVATPKWNLAAFDKAPEALLKPKQEPANEPDIAAVRAHNQRRLQLLDFA